MKQLPVFISLLIAMFCVACSTFEPTSPSSSIESTLTTKPPTLYSSIYFRPINDTIVSDAVLNKYKIRPVHSMSEAIVISSKIDVIYIDVQMVDAVNETWLQEQYARGATIVGINIPLSVLAQMVHMPPRIADLKPLNEGFYISMLHPVYDKEQNITGWSVYTEYYSSFDDIPLGVNTILELNGRIP